MAYFINGDTWKKKVKADMLELLKRNMGAFNNQSNQLLKQSIRELGVVDTGQVLDSSYANAKSTPTSVILQAFTPVAHGIYPLLGLGSNRGYGPRNWFFLWAYKIMQTLGIKSKMLTTYQPKAVGNIKKSYSVTTRKRAQASQIKPLSGFTRSDAKFTKSGAISVKFTRK